MIKIKKLKEEMPVNNVSGGNIAGLGVGPKGEPGVKKRKTASFIAYMRRKNVPSN